MARLLFVLPLLFLFLNKPFVKYNIIIYNQNQNLSWYFLFQLFIAPRGRSYEDFKKESIKHGWPSFRPEEMITENVILHQDGRMESKCLTHL